MLTKERIIEELETIYDPEVHLDIWTMGLIYDIHITDTVIHIVMTYTTPMCPAGPLIQDQIRDALISIGASAVTFEVTFDPPWKPPEALRAMMGI
ncbi:MAG TPA: metal-sulfur cluster assembly factor [Candidatus Kapabacteria bacterium]|nr:metal-sulfur cluster assembly factor [Candidatus Kapabacteria bacterium]